MQKLFSIFQSSTQDASDTPDWVLEKIREAKERNLNSLDLSLTDSSRREKLAKFPDEILRLSRLKHLKLSHNNLSVLPDSISQLKNLTHLDLSNNRFNKFPDSVLRLHKLIDLDLSTNQIHTLPESIGQLQNLNFLDLRYNQFSALPQSIKQLEKLISLYVSHNQLNTFSESIGLSANLTYVDLEDNPLIGPPIDIATNGVGAIQDYYRQINQEGADHIYEAKLLILGDAEVGKTTFANKILNSNYNLKKEDSTKGVDILKWSFPIEDKLQFKVNIWDFGGQEIYYATHQFFLTKRSLYTLVADSRKDDTDFYYWLNATELLSFGSPLLIIINEREDRAWEINPRQLKGQFDSLKEVIATNLATNRGLEEIKDEIKHYLRKLPHIGSPLPKSWVRVREQLEKEQRNYISVEEYFTVCRQNGFIETDDMLQLSSYLHDIGIFLHFQDDRVLKKIVILKSKWGTDAVYKVLDNPTVIRNLGRFSRADLKRLWDAPEYKMVHDELLQLMMKFRLCYEITTEEGVYIAPQLLTESQPDYKWNNKDNLLLRYSYDFMPKGILTKFIVVMHRYILEQKIVWKSGVVIEKNRTFAEVIEYPGKREIHVRVAGEQSSDWMIVIQHQLEQIHATYRRLKYYELIQCNCPSCKDNPEPHFYPIALLKEMRVNNQPEIQCQKKPYLMVSVMGLLGDVFDHKKKFNQGESQSITYIQEYHHYERDAKMTKINQTVKNSTIHGSVVAAESIKDSFNAIEKADIKDDLKELLKQLTQAVDTMIKEKDLPKEKAEEAADAMKYLADQATKEKPNPTFYNVSIEGLIAAAQNLGTVGDAVIELVGKVRKILTGGLL